MEFKSGQGGYRKNAGRKPHPTKGKRVKLAIYMYRESWQYLKKNFRDYGHGIEEMIEEHKKK